MEIAHAQIQRPGKGEDAFLVRRIDDSGTAQLLAIADGVSMNDGKLAARWVIDCLARIDIVPNPHGVFERVQEELAKDRKKYRETETTLTCGVLSECDLGHGAFLRFDFFAIGDSPVWKVVTVPKDSKYRFQRILVHGSPFPSETARVYGTVRLHRKDINGTVTFGSVEVRQGEVLVVCSDGIPERDVFLPRAKVDRVRIGDDPGDLCRWMFQQTEYRDRDLMEILGIFERQGFLSDDATIIVARPRLASLQRSEGSPRHPTTPVGRSVARGSSRATEVVRPGENHPSAPPTFDPTLKTASDQTREAGTPPIDGGIENGTATRSEAGSSDVVAPETNVLSDARETPARVVERPQLGEVPVDLPQGGGAEFQALGSGTEGSARPHSVLPSSVSRQSEDLIAEAEAAAADHGVTVPPVAVASRGLGEPPDTEVEESEITATASTESESEGSSIPAPAAPTGHFLEPSGRNVDLSLDHSLSADSGADASQMVTDSRVSSTDVKVPIGSTQGGGLMADAETTAVDSLDETPAGPTDSTAPANLEMSVIEAEQRAEAGGRDEPVGTTSGQLSTVLSTEGGTRLEHQNVKVDGSDDEVTTKKPDGTQSGDR